MPKWMMGRNSIRTIMMRLKFIFFEPRWSIIKSVGNSIKGTNEIYEDLHKMGIMIPRTTLYYHISLLEKEGIMEMTGYREVGGGAPEKLWRLKVRRICVDTITGKIIEEEGEKDESSNTRHR